jgi:NitT/TauT family transport system substrate-binding protein
MNEALISGESGFRLRRSGPLVNLGAYKDNLKVKGIAALNSMPLWLNSINPA